MAEPSDSRPRLLLVDDQPEILMFYQSALGERYEMETATDGRDAIDKVENGGFHCILSDISMPNMNGLELLKAVRRIDMDVPVILVTGDPSLDSAIKAVEFGALRYLTKPVKPTDLRRVVDYGVKMHQMALAKRDAYRMLSGEDGTASDRAGLESQLEAALETMWMAFQPIVSWNNKNAIGYEALLRTDEPTLRNPQVLLETAEYLGRVQEVSRMIRSRAAAMLDQLPSDAYVFVNLHQMDLNDSHLFEANAPLSRVADRVVLEVTEKATLEQIKTVRTRLADLRRMGFRIAMDDLGASHSGLATFAQLEPDVVKLDMSLVRGIETQPTRQRLVASMCGLCTELEIKFVAEGIETPEERDTLVGIGCDLLQGYLFGKPNREILPPVF